MDAITAKALALEIGFDKVGIVGPELAPGAPLWTKSVLVVGLATLDEAFDYEIYIAYDGRRRWHKFVYEVLEAKGARLANRLYPTPVTRLQCVACMTVCPVGQRRRIDMWIDRKTS
jgi:hypothetical protein